MNDLEEIIYKHALLNAAKHKGSANPGAVMGSIMSNEPELRSKAKEIGPMSGKIVAKVNALFISAKCLSPKSEKKLQIFDFLTLFKIQDAQFCAKTCHKASSLGQGATISIRFLLTGCTNCMRLA